MSFVIGYFKKIGFTKVSTTKSRLLVSINSGQDNQTIKILYLDTLNILFVSIIDENDFIKGIFCDSERTEIEYKFNLSKYRAKEVIAFLKTRFEKAGYIQHVK